MLFFSPSRGKTYDIPEDKLADFLGKVPDAIRAEEGMTPVPPSAAPAAPAAVPMTEAPAATAEPETTVSGLLGSFARGAAPVAAGAMMGAPLGPAGMAAGAGAGALWQLLADPAMGFINWAAGTDYPMPTKTLEKALSDLGIAEPKTAAERLVQQATAGAYGGVGGAGLAQTIAGPAAGAVSGGQTLTQRVATQAAKQPGVQAFAGGTAGLAGQAAAEEGVGPGGQALAALAGGMAGGVGAGRVAGRPVPTAGVIEPPVPAAVPSRPREALTKMLENIGKEADVARVKTAGPKAIDLAEATGGAGVKETARVMRAAGMGGIKSPKAIAGRAGEVIEETNALIGRIVEEVDTQGAAMMRQADELRASLDPAKVKAAEEAARNADEIEAAVAAAEKRLLDEEAELGRAATASGMRQPAKGFKEPGVVNVNEAQLQQNAKEAAEEAAAKAAAAEDAMKAAHRERRGVPASRKMFQAMLLQNEADMAAAKANQLAQDARLGTASYEEPMPMRSVVGARRVMESRQRELDMMRAAAKRAREDAMKAADEAGVTAVNARAEQLVAEAGKRKVSGKAIADRVRAEMRNILVKQTPNTMDPDNISSDTLRNEYRFLENAANRLEREGDLTLRQTYDRLRPIEEDAGYGRRPPGKKQAKSETAKVQSRAMREEMAAPIEEALPAEGGISDVTTSPYARIGRGAPVEGPVSGREAFGSFRRAGSVARDIAESSAAQLEGIEKGAVPGNILSERLPAFMRQRMPTGFEATLRERAQTAGQSLREPTVEEMALQQGVPASFLEALRQIDEESAP